MSCRKTKPRCELVRLGLDGLTGQVKLLSCKELLWGRSAYLCCSQPCLDAALKGTRLKAALEGRKRKDRAKQRLISWPLEAQLIQELSSHCAQSKQTCKNTQKKETSE
ncbi:MAG: DUF448 domain-containing protein [Candidatus Melainabacteria bacterium]|nr:DUF448 domain-containing protein [Candidatus Melainabacteria bacterium]